jgi:hypothetical protein
MTEPSRWGKVGGVIILVAIFVALSFAVALWNRVFDALWPR